MAKKRSIYIFVAFIIAVAAISAGLVKYTDWLSKKFLKMDVVKHFSFSKANALRKWRPKVFKGRVDYKIDTEGGESFVSAVSEKSASALFYKVRLDMDKKPVISWKWNVKKFPDKEGTEDLKSAKKDDFGARIYVIFPAFFFTSTRAIEYIWTEKIKEGTISPSPYSRNLQLIVVESGKKEGVEWVYEERDVYSDYMEAFGEKPRYDIGAIAIMTDSDSTKSSAEAAYDDIKIGYKMEKIGRAR
ncbi:DUF3047 domain-containing protein [Omnitrophica bacterium]|nr:DUF3047 domain-containing protein [Candidatus Omnitrophota bacterium]